MIRRIILVLSVAALMAVMLVAMAAPAMASKFGPKQFGSCGAKGVSLEEFDPEFFAGYDFATFPRGGPVKGQSQQVHECPND